MQHGIGEMIMYIAERRKRGIRGLQTRRVDPGNPK